MGLRVLMMGTGEFALPAFRQLIASEHDVIGLVTQPDRVGQGHHQHVNPLKELALSHGIPVFQPQRVNLPDSLEELRRFNADLFVVAAYGQILSADLLAIPPHGAINLHGSLLPKFRGAAPVQYAVWKGEQESGVTIFQIEPKLDAGPMLGVVKTPIGPKETSGQLHDRLAELAAPLTLEVLQGFVDGSLRHEIQPVGGVTKAPRLKKEEGLINWSLPARELDCHIRGMQPWPMPYTFLHVENKKPQRILILDVDPVSPPASSSNECRPGEVVIADQQLNVRVGQDSPAEWIRINSLQPAGKRAMTAAEFLRGTNLQAATFGNEVLA